MTAALPPLDVATVVAGVYREVRDRLAAVPDTPGKVAAARAIVDEASDGLDGLVAELERAAVSLALHDGATRVYAAAGMARNTFSRMLGRALGGPAPHNVEARPAAARAAGVPRVPDAAGRLPGLAADVARRRALIETAQAAAARLATDRPAAGGKTRTRHGGTLPPAPIAAWTGEETAAARGRFEGPTLPKARADAAAAFAAEAEEGLPDLVGRLGAAAVSAVVYDGHRNVAAAAGLTGARLAELQRAALGIPEGPLPPVGDERAAAARAAGVPYVENAQEVLASLAEQVARRRARITAAHVVTGPYAAPAPVQRVRSRNPRSMAPLPDAPLAEERERTLAELNAAADPWARLAAAAQVQWDTEARLPGLREEAYALALSASLYGRAKAVETALGRTRAAWVKVQRDALRLDADEPFPKPAEQEAAARAAGVPQILGAVDKLPPVALEMRREEVRREAALAVRNAAIGELHHGPQKVSVPELAEATGYTRSVIQGVLRRA